MIHEIVEHQKNFFDITNEPSTSRLMSGCGKAGMFDNARKLFNEMPDLKCPRKVYSLNALLTACIYSGKFDEFERTVKDLPRKLGIELDVVSYNIIIKGFYKMGAFENGALVVEEMVKKGVKPNVTSFNTLLNGFYGNERFVEGERIWNRMVEMHVVPNVRTYNAKLLGLAMEKRIEECVGLVDEMSCDKRIELDLFSFNAWIKGFVMDENLTEAKCEMRKSDCAPDSTTMETLVAFLYEKGDVDFAYEICEDILIRKCAIGVKLLQLVVDGLVKQCKIQEAKRLVQLVKKALYSRFNYPKQREMEMKARLSSHHNAKDDKHETKAYKQILDILWSFNK